ncbi:uncharacterized protein LOC105703493 isoform X2 [Orussus abietinus]|uniref:uncharacterized protein LOC105703493 isoform X2 n=1 Tax=Orussus abietinus TaxID=222816 RepID=UPI000C715B0F|nr:uncharacterized protein LOC105703493 isoform X2 [Orussus abietinus]
MMPQVDFIEEEEVVDVTERVKKMCSDGKVCVATSMPGVLDTGPPAWFKDYMETFKKDIMSEVTKKIATVLTETLNKSRLPLACTNWEYSRYPSHSDFEENYQSRKKKKVKKKGVVAKEEESMNSKKLKRIAQKSRLRSEKKKWRRDLSHPNGLEKDLDASESNNSLKGDSGTMQRCMVPESYPFAVPSTVKDDALTSDVNVPNGNKLRMSCSITGNKLAGMPIIADGDFDYPPYSENLRTSCSTSETEPLGLLHSIDTHFGYQPIRESSQREQMVSDFSSNTDSDFGAMSDDKTRMKCSITGHDIHLDPVTAVDYEDASDSDISVISHVSHRSDSNQEGNFEVIPMPSCIISKPLDRCESQAAKPMEKSLQDQPRTVSPCERDFNFVSCGDDSDIDSNRDSPSFELLSESTSPAVSPQVASTEAKAHPGVKDLDKCTLSVNLLDFGDPEPKTTRTGTCADKLHNTEDKVSLRSEAPGGILIPIEKLKLSSCSESEVSQEVKTEEAERGEGGNISTILCPENDSKSTTPSTAGNASKFIPENYRLVFGGGSYVLTEVQDDANQSSEYVFNPNLISIDNLADEVDASSMANGDHETKRENESPERNPCTQKTTNTSCVARPHNPVPDIDDDSFGLVNILPEDILNVALIPVSLWSTFRGVVFRIVHAHTGMDLDP